MPPTQVNTEAVIALYTGSVPDTVQPGFLDQNGDGVHYAPDGVPLSADGLFTLANDIDPTVLPLKEVSKTLTDANYLAMADHLIPRAVAYGAGFLDYFFRGRIGIAPPDEGIYSLVGHAIAHTVINGVPYRGDGGNTQTSNVFGFSKIRLKLRNETPDVNDGTNPPIPQDFTQGELIAVARFRTNPCYEPDLSGEFHAGLVIPSGCSASLILNDAQRVLLSQSIPISSSRDLPHGYMPMEFDFSANPIPIPVNAMDLVLQIVYRGTFGAEEDAVVIATRDLYESTYLSYANGTDYTNINGVLYSEDAIQASSALLQAMDASPQGDKKWGDEDDSPEPYSRIPSDNLKIWINGGTEPAVSLGSLPPRRYVRIATLQDSSPFSVRTESRMDQVTNSEDFTFNAVDQHIELQEDGAQNYLVSNFGEYRGYTYFNLVSSHRNYGTQDIGNLAPVAADLVMGMELDPVPVVVHPAWQ